MQPEKPSHSVGEWKQFFVSRWKEKLGTDPHFLTETTPSRERAKVVAASWFAFSDFMPKLLSQACVSASNNKMRAEIVQVLYEELGKMDGEDIHCEMFADATLMANLAIKEWDSRTQDERIRVTCDWLLNKVRTTPNDSFLSGILLGLEIMANENIETIFQGLCHHPDLADAIESTAFFLVHRKNEDGHIELNLKNFFTFSFSEEEQMNFIKGYDVGVNFWKRFWEIVNEIISEEHNHAKQPAYVS